MLEPYELQIMQSPQLSNIISSSQIIDNRSIGDFFLYQHFLLILLWVTITFKFLCCLHFYSLYLVFSFFDERVLWFHCLVIVGSEFSTDYCYYLFIYLCVSYIAFCFLDSLNYATQKKNYNRKVFATVFCSYLKRQQSNAPSTMFPTTFNDVSTSTGSQKF